MRTESELSPVVVAGPGRGDHALTSDVLNHSLRVIGPRGAVAELGDRSVACSLTGNAILGRAALLSNKSLASALEETGDVSTFIDLWARRVKNPSAGMIVDYAAQAVHILPDPLGGCIVFHCQFDEITFVSTDLGSLITVAATYGYRPKKSLIYQLERSVLGNGGLTHSSYTGISALQMMDYAEVNAEGLSIVSYPVKQQYLDPEISYSSAMDAYQQDVLDSIEAISRIDDSSIAHLTGGFDSRLVLAGIMNAKKEDRFVYFCSGPVGTADRDTADGLAASLGLIRTQEAGLSSDTPESVEDRFLAPMANSAGLTSSGPLGTEKFNGKVVAGGGYGGLLRSVYSTLVNGRMDEMDAEVIAEKFWGAPATDTNGLMTDISKKDIIDRLALVLGDLKQQGYEDDYLGDAFYLTHRNRYHFGQNSTLWSRVGRRFDPLYSIHGPRLARMLPIDARKTNVAGFDLMASMYPQLLSYPFDRPRFGDEYAKIRRVPPGVSFGSGKPRVRSTPPVNRPVARPVTDPEKRKKQILQARKMGVNFWQIEAMAETQQGLAALLSDLDVSDLDNAVNVDYVRFLAKDTLRTRSQVRHLYAVYSMLLWYVRP